MMKLAYHVMSSPVGLLFLARTPRGLRYLEFMDRKSLKRMIASHAAENPDATWEPSLLSLKPWVDELEQFFCGNRFTFQQPLDVLGSEFQRQVWDALRAIPFGETRSYGDIAKTIGQPRASRAVGLANHENPVVIVVPCHRVIGAGGAMVGYGGGMPRKKWLLDHEARFSEVPGRTGDLFTSARAGGALVAAPPRATAAARARTTTPARVRATTAVRASAATTRPQTRKTQPGRTTSKRRARA
jgi:methylated-DNA-[protein]-cysteine S-methyltransferase